MINDNDDASYVAEALAEARQPTPDYIRENDLWWEYTIWRIKRPKYSRNDYDTWDFQWKHSEEYHAGESYRDEEYIKGTWQNDRHEWQTGDTSIPQVKRPMRPTKQLAKKDRELIRVQRAIIRSRRFELRDYAKKRHKKFTSTQALVKETLRSVRRNEVDP
jgi:hypothetical protein